MEDNILFEIILPAILSVFTGVGGWYVARRKNVAEAQNSELDNVEKAVGFYREMAEDMAKRAEEVTSQHLLTLDNLKAMREDIEGLEKKVRDLLQENRSLLSELKKYKQLNGKSS